MLQCYGSNCTLLSFWELSYEDSPKEEEQYKYSTTQVWLKELINIISVHGTRRNRSNVLGTVNPKEYPIFKDLVDIDEDSLWNWTGHPSVGCLENDYDNDESQKT